MENNTANVNQENGAPAGKKGLPAYIILGIIALVAAVALAVTNMITKGPIPVSYTHLTLPTNREV